MECITSVSVFPFEATRSSAIGRSPSAFGLVQVNSIQPAGQAQYVANHLDVSDPAMSPDERQTAIEAYLAFADKINRIRAPEARNCIQSDHHTMRIATEAFEFIELPGGLELYNWTTRQRVRLGSIWSRILTTLSALPGFERQDLVSLLGDNGETVDLVIRKLYEYGLVECEKRETNKSTIGMNTPGCFHGSRLTVSNTQARYGTDIAFRFCPGHRVGQMVVGHSPRKMESNR